MDLKPVEERASALISQVTGLDSVRAVLNWDNLATETIGQLEDASRQLQQEIDSLRQEAIAKEAEYKTKGFWQRAKTLNPATALKVEASNLETKLKSLPGVIDKLESWRERTPDSIEEAKLAIAEFKLAKKELALEKKEVAAQARQVREAHAKKTAAISTGWGSSKSRQFSRSMARISKEVRLSNV